MHSFGFGLAENQVRSWGLYLEEFEPVQILTTIDGSWISRCRLASYSSELSLTAFLLLKSSNFCRLSFFSGPGITNYSLSPDRFIGNSMLRYLLKINVTSLSLSMYVNFATRIADEISLSLLTMTRWRHSAVRTYRQTDFGKLYISWHSAQFSQLVLFCNDNRFACTSFKKTFFKFEILNGNTSRFAPCRISLKMCIVMTEEDQAHYFGNILAIPIPI